MFPSLEAKLRRFEELEEQLQDPDVLANVDKMLAVQREYGGLQKVALSIRAYNERQADIEAAEQTDIAEQAEMDYRAALALQNEDNLGDLQAC